MNTAIVILAAGAAARMGKPKLLLPIGSQTLLERAISTATLASSGPIVVVLGSEPERFLPVLGDAAISCVINPEWKSGMGSSIRAGVNKVIAHFPQCDGVVIMAADQPEIKSRFLAELIASLDEHPIAASRYNGTLGIPAAFRAEIFAELTELDPGHGAKGLITRNPERVTALDCPEAALDIDTPEDYERYVSPNR